jgi:hypothetical protein
MNSHHTHFVRARYFLLPVVVALSGASLSHSAVAQFWPFGTSVPQCSDPEILAEVKEGITSWLKKPHVHQ